MMGFTDITDEDTHPYRTKYKVAREKVRKLNENLDERSKAMESPSTTDAEAIEMIEVTSKDIDTTVKDVEQDTSFIKPSERDNLLPLRELEGLDKQLRTVKGSLKGEASKQINQIKESITKFLDKEMGTLGEEIRTLLRNRE